MILGIIQTNNFNLLFPGKSGSKTIGTDILGDPDWHYNRQYLDVRDWVSNFDDSKLNILVIRNPVERFISGASSHWIVEDLVDYNKFMMHHGNPFMKYIPNLSFKIIEFEKLWFDFGVEERNPSRDSFKHNADLKDELEAWGRIKNKQEEVTATEWELLKRNIHHVNYENTMGYDVIKSTYEVTLYE